MTFGNCLRGWVCFFLDPRRCWGGQEEGGVAPGRRSRRRGRGGGVLADDVRVVDPGVGEFWEAVVGGAVAGVVDPDIVLGGRVRSEDDGLDGQRCRPVSWIPASGRSGSGSAEKASGGGEEGVEGSGYGGGEGGGGEVEAAVERRA
uniref:Uncharacterized protein n=1 Tax=Oryza sativa subsp. japonica TaxID=39947 RepID=Q2QMS0_ORYSJ|nr:hypothetical protein LOC_Os12g40240 [Oryza sativa Japonica Group]